MERDTRISKEVNVSPIHPRPEGPGLPGLNDKNKIFDTIKGRITGNSIAKSDPIVSFEKIDVMQAIAWLAVLLFRIMI